MCPPPQQAAHPSVEVVGKSKEVKRLSQQAQPLKTVEMNARLGFQGLAARAYINFGKEHLVPGLKGKVYGLTCHLVALKLV